MADETTVDGTLEAAEAAQPAKKTTAKKTAAKKTAAKKTTAKKTTAKAPAKRATKKAAAAPVDEALPLEEPVAEQAPEGSAEAPAPAKKTAKKAAAKKTTTKRAAAKKAAEPPVESAAAAVEEAAAEPAAEEKQASGVAPLFQVPDATKAAPVRRRTRKPAEPAPEETAEETAEEPAERPVEKPARKRARKAAEKPVEEPAEAPAEAPVEEPAEAEAEETDESDDTAPSRRRRRRGGRRRRKSGEGNGEDRDEQDDEDEESAEEPEGEDADAGTSRRRRRRRRSGEAGGEDDDNPPNTVTKVRESRPLEQQITAVSGSTRLEAKKQRRREGREAGRRRAPIVSEAEFLARRESVDRVMVIRQRDDLTQIGVLEDKVLVEHYVARESQTSLIGNIYLGRVQNVLPSMEAAFIDIGKGRNAVLYAGEVNWSALGWKEGQPRKIESVLSSGQPVLVQVTKDPIGHKGARLTSQISLAGRFLVYVPDGTTSGISRKLPDTERNRLKTLLKEIVPDTAGVIVRTAAEGASEDELTRDVERLTARWDEIEAKSKGNAPQLLYGEPDLTLKVVRDLFTEDFAKLVIQGEDAWQTVQGYVSHVAPDLESRLERFESEDGRDAFWTYRIDEQIAKGLDRKVWLPSGGSLIIDRTEAMTVIDVNTGKFTGSGGNLEETVTKNNLEAAEEIVRQLRLRDIGGIIVVDFIDMVLESNRDLVLRRLVECLGRDRTRHQVAEVTSLGLVQMTRKRIGTGLLEAFSENCTHCQGRGIVVHDHPVEDGKSSGVAPDEPRRSRRRGGRGRGAAGEEQGGPETPKAPSPADIAAMPRHEEHEDAEEFDVEPVDAEPVAAEPIDAEPIDAEPIDAEPIDAEPEPVVEPERVVEPEVPAEPEKPRVVTRARRGASRAVVTTGTAAVVEAPAAVVVPEPVDVPAPEKPKVSTRSRRGASREVTTAAPVETGTLVVEAPTETVPGPEEPHVEHVPVKKKGARKR